MKTPDEIKKGLECCQHDPYSGLCHCEKGCPYWPTDKCDHLRRDALALIQRLEEKYERAMENAKILSDAVTKLERERDAAVKDVKSLCATTHFYDDYCEYCKYKEEDGQCNHECVPYSNKWGFEWRGLPEV